MVQMTLTLGTDQMAGKMQSTMDFVGLIRYTEHITGWLG